MEATERIIITEVTQEHHEELQNYILKDVKEIPTENEDIDMSKAGAYGNLIDLEWNGTHLAGKVLHSIFFAPKTEPNSMRKILTRFFEEIKLLSKMKHANIVQFLGMYYRQDSLLPVLVMEKMECDLNQYLTTHKKGSIPDDRALGILLDVSKGLVYLHEEMKVAHRDLSSKNILLTAKFSAKIADLGSARVLDRPGGWASHVQLTTQPGTTDFMPPEALEDPPKYTVSVDVFSFGCVTIHLCTHRWPTPIGKTAKGKIISEFGRRQKCTEDMNYSYLLPIIKQCLEEQSTKRPTSRDLTSLLEAKIEEYTQNVDYTIVFSGITGMGKSTAGNFFLNKVAFPTEEGFISCTEECSAGTSIVCGKKVKIIDTPGFFDDFSSDEGNFKEFSRALTLAKDGIHAVAFVMRYGRFTKACKEAIQQLQLLKGIQPFVFVLLTHAKKNGITTTATAEYIEQCLSSNRCAPGLRTLIEVAENRVVMLEAVDFISEEYHEQKCLELLMMIEKIHKVNNRMYNNSMLKYAAEVYGKVKQKQREEIQATMTSLESNSQKIVELKQQINDITISADNKEAVEKINKEIVALQKENEGLGKRLEEISNEQYLVQLTNETLQKQMSGGYLKGNFVDFLGTVSLTTIGGIMGGTVGIIAGPRFAQAGAAIGAGIGGAITMLIGKNCNQQ